MALRIGVVAIVASALLGCSVHTQSPIRQVAYDFSDYAYYDRSYAPSPAYAESTGYYVEGIVPVAAHQVSLGGQVAPDAQSGSPEREGSASGNGDADSDAADSGSQDQNRGDTASGDRSAAPNSGGSRPVTGGVPSAERPAPSPAGRPGVAQGAGDGRVARR